LPGAGSRHAQRSTTAAATTISAQVTDVTAAQFTYAIDGNSAVQGVNYLAIEDLPEVISR